MVKVVYLNVYERDEPEAFSTRTLADDANRLASTWGRPQRQALIEIAIDGQHAFASVVPQPIALKENNNDQG